jgi:hypothetical protein
MSDFLQVSQEQMGHCLRYRDISTKEVFYLVREGREIEVFYRVFCNDFAFSCDCGKETCSHTLWVLASIHERTRILSLSDESVSATKKHSSKNVDIFSVNDGLRDYTVYYFQSGSNYCCLCPVSHSGAECYPHCKHIEAVKRYQLVQGAP